MDEVISFSNFKLFWFRPVALRDACAYRQLAQRKYYLQNKLRFADTLYYAILFKESTLYHVKFR
jgi:hypothetical protein